MEKTRKHDWLIAQGYRPSTLRPFVTWYAKDREFKGRTDDYTLNLYRSKGFVLDRKFLDPGLWQELEYGKAHTPITIEHREPVPRLARAIVGVMNDRDSWEGTASDLLTLLDSRKEGIPKDAIRLSTEVMKPRITDALQAHGLTVHRKRTASKRLLQMKSITRKNQ